MKAQWTATFVLILLLGVSSATILCGQESHRPSPLEKLKYFVGKWEGTGLGEPGHSTLKRSYQYALGQHFIFVKNTSTYEPQEKNPKGELHEDEGYISYDKGRKVFVLRQFHVEGFVNQYVLDTLNSTEKSMVFVSEAIENIAKGWQARETYTIVNDDQFVERVELAAPGKEFELYVENRFRRAVD